MPVFFEMRSTVEPVMRRRNADALAEILQDSLKPFDVRVVSIRKTDSQGFVYGCAAVRWCSACAPTGVSRNSASAMKAARRTDRSSRLEPASHRLAQPGLKCSDRRP